MLPRFISTSEEDLTFIKSCAFQLFSQAQASSIAENLVLAKKQITRLAVFMMMIMMIIIIIIIIIIAGVKLCHSGC